MTIVLSKSIIYIRLTLNSDNLVRPCLFDAYFPSMTSSSKLSKPIVSRIGSEIPKWSGDGWNSKDWGSSYNNSLHVAMSSIWCTIRCFSMFQGLWPLKRTHQGFQLWKPSIWRELWVTSKMRWPMLEHRIVHRMDNIVTCKELLYDDPQSFEFHPSSDSLGSIVPIIETIGWESLEEDVMEGK